MKKVSLILLIVLLINCFAGLGVFAEGFDDFIFEEFYGETTDKITSASAWGEFLFVSGDTGLKIYNTNSKELEATWNLKSNSIIPTVGSNFVPSSTVVTDDYIIVLSTTNFIAVFPNEGEYTNTPPTLIRRLGVFNNQPRMVYENGYLYVLDQAAASTVAGNGTTTYKAEEKSVILWKIDIKNVESFPVTQAARYPKYCLLNVENMISNGYSELINLGLRDYIWGAVAKEDGIMYAVTYNDTSTTPYKTLYLHSIDLENMEESNIVLSESTPAGLIVSFFTESGNATALRNELAVYEVGNEENSELVKNFTARNVLISCVDYSDGSYYTTIYFKDVANFENLLGVSEAELSSGSKKFAISYADTEYELTYSANTESIKSGALTVKDGMVYVMTGHALATNNAATTGINYAWAVNVYDMDNMEITGETMISLMPNNGANWASSVQTCVAIGNSLVYFVPGTRNAPVIDLSHSEEFDTSISKTISLQELISTASVLSQAFDFGGKLYYPTTSRMASIDHNVYINELYAPANAVKFPVSISGESSEGKEAGGVYVSIDGIESYADAVSGAYLKRVLTMPNGECTVSALGNEKTVTVDIPDAVEITDITAESGIAFTAVNNTNKYLKKTADIKFIAVSYDASGNYIDHKETTESCAYGEEKAVTIEMPDTEDGGYIMIYPLSGSILLDVPTKTDETKADRAIRFAEDKEITATSVVNEADKTVTASGNYIAGADLYIETTRTGGIADINYVRCDENGDFSYTYFYDEDVIATTETYTVTLTDIQKSATITADLTNDGSFEAAMDTLKAEVTTASELVSYLDNNTDVALALGIDTSNAKYSSLSTTNKAKVMEPVLEKINNSSYSGISAVFAEKTNTVYTSQRKETALSKVQNATSSSLKGILETYKDVYGISDSLWTQYNNLEDDEIEDANDYFINKKANIKQLSDVPVYLRKAVDSLDDDDDDDPPTLGGGSSNSGGSYQSGNNIIPTLPNVTPAAKMFDDVADNHWAKSCIEELAKEGVINGIGNRLYAPEDYVTREQMVKILIEAFGMNKAGATVDFADVDKNEWYYPYIASAAEIGLAQGDGVNFGTGNYVTRQDATVMLYRMAGILDTEITGDKTTFTDDAEIADYAKEAVYKMQGSGVINGTGANKFSPNEPCTRAMAAKIVYELKKICGR